MARCLKHAQPDPLPIRALSPLRVEYFWGWLQDNLNTFDDYTSMSREEFERFLFAPACESFEVGDGVGLYTIIYDGVNAYIHMVMLDWKFRLDVCEKLIHYVFSSEVERLTSTVSEDRASARDLVKGLGFKYEGTLRQAYYRPTRVEMFTDDYHDVEVWGLLKEDWNGYRSSSGDCSGGGDRGRSDCGAWSAGRSSGVEADPA